VAFLSSQLKCQRMRPPHNIAIAPGEAYLPAVYISGLYFGAELEADCWLLCCKLITHTSGTEHVFLIINHRTTLEVRVAGEMESGRVKQELGKVLWDGVKCQNYTFSVPECLH